MSASHRCIVCNRLGAGAELEVDSVTASKPGWCGGPRQGGRAAYVHVEECKDALAAQRALIEAGQAARRELVTLRRGRNDRPGAWAATELTDADAIAALELEAGR